MARSNSRGLLYTAPPETDANREQEAGADANQGADTPAATTDRATSEHSNTSAPADD